MKLSPEEMISTIFKTADVNVERNYESIHDVDDAKHHAQEYLKQFGSNISRDVTMVSDRDEFREMLIDEIHEMSFAYQILCHWVDEIDRHEELEAIDNIQQILEGKTEEEAEEHLLKNLNEEIN